VYRDLEAQVVIVTSNPLLRQQLHDVCLITHSPAIYKLVNNRFITCERPGKGIRGVESVRILQ